MTDNTAPDTTEQKDKDYRRLSDLILEAMHLALEQKDVVIADLLSRAMEMSLTRNAGGRNFIERRDLSDDVEVALEKLVELRRSVTGKQDG
ncbi:MAG: hypothetical protein GC185_01500 [Alphaproteobacteria bacterium]|nr:hypothetical protein [Alphaproteobacteria bacterium]